MGELLDVVVVHIGDDGFDVNGGVDFFELLFAGDALGELLGDVVFVKEDLPAGGC